MNISYIKTFIAVYRAGSFSKVANDQNVAPSSVSRAIGALETSLKTRLFQRTTRRLEPTQAGEAYFEKTAPLVEELEFAHQTLIDSTLKPSGHLRVTASVTYGQVVLAPKLRAFRTLYPDIDLELVLSDRRIELVDERIDVAIRHGRLPDSTLVARKLAGVSYKLVAAPDYLYRKGTPQRQEDLDTHELITFPYAQFRNLWKFEKESNSRALSIRPALTVSNAATIRACVRQGVGIALLPDWAISNDLDSGRLIELLADWRISGESDDPSIWLVYPSGRYLPAKTRAFADFLLSDNEQPI